MAAGWKKPHVGVMRLRPVSPAVVIAVLALVVALCGTTVAGYAAGKASGNSLIKKHSLSGNRLKADSVTGKQVAEGSLGTVPSAGTAGNAAHAALADSVPAPAFQPLATNPGWAATSPGSFGWRKDVSGFVHLQGAVTRSSGSSADIATLPVGIRPAVGACVLVFTAGGTVGSVCIRESGMVEYFSGNTVSITLANISYYAG